mgnify:CR=1 FL=1
MKSKNRELFKTNSLRLQAADLQLITYNLENLYEFNIEYEFLPGKEMVGVENDHVFADLGNHYREGLPGLVAQRKLHTGFQLHIGRNIFLREVDDGLFHAGTITIFGSDIDRFLFAQAHAGHGRVDDQPAGAGCPRAKRRAVAAPPLA